jgi:hypothetical protein
MHCIEGLIFSSELAPEAQRLVPGARLAALTQGFSFLPVNEDLFDSARIEHVARELSAHGAVAYVETDYFAGEGLQSSVVWKNHEVVLPARSAAIGPINEALAMLGVGLDGHRDEFDALGLHRFRSNHDWLEQAT